jgi:hypothetical protein
MCGRSVAASGDIDLSQESAFPQVERPEIAEPWKHPPATEGMRFGCKAQPRIKRGIVEDGKACVADGISEVGVALFPTRMCD